MRTTAMIAALILVAGCGGGSGSGDADTGEDTTMDTDAAEDGAEADPDAVDGDDGDADADAPEDAVGDGDADGEEWVNPGCTAAANYVEDDIRLELLIDLAGYAGGDFATRERVTVTPTSAGEAVSFFGEGFDMGWASAGYSYDSHSATFCTGAFDAGEDVTVEAEFVSHEAPFPMGLRRWEDSHGLVVGPSTEPYFAPLWFLVPQSLHWIDDVHDDSPSVSSVDLTVIAPDGTWTVVGPGGPGVRDGNSWSFSLDVPQPAYAVSFAASPDYETFTVGITSSGVEVIGAVTASTRAAAEACYPAAIETIDWMEENVGPWDWGGYLTLAEIPGYGGGMEHSTVIWFGSDTIEAGFPGDFIVTHETVHHWWGDNVRFTDWPHFWIAEGFDEWHTNFNILGGMLTPEGFDALKLYYRTDAADETYPAAASDPPPGPLRFDDGDDCIEQWFSNMNIFYVYGAAFLEMVNQRLIRDFSTDLNTVLAAWFDANRLGEATTEEFLAFLEATTGDPLYWAPLFDDWVYTTPAPTLEVGAYSYLSGNASVEVRRIDGADQSMEALDVIFTSGADSFATTVDLPAGTDVDTASVAMPSAPDGIVLDPNVFYVFRLTTEGGWTGPEVGFTYE